MKVHPIPLRDDNYGYLVVDAAHPTKGVLVDPYDVPTCQAHLKQHGITEVVGNITTHHHFDHSGGNEAFHKAYPDAPIFGGSDKVPCLSRPVKHGDAFPLFPGSSIQVKTYATPCHTQDSTAFFLEDSKAKDGEYTRGVFTGDTLFVSGCGRFFEGTPEEMHTALNKTLAGLPGDTVVFCGHEYTKGNVAFSAGVVPNNAAVQKLVEFVRTGQNKGVTTGVFTIDDEKRHNVFMLVDDAEVKKAIGLESAGPVEVMAKLRELKNSGQMMAKV
ncbi:Metallo-hydrolase/oxidoreductase [Acaromyces ingoldii]|uniref:hydroxyacylglutathione hydrolase n=1 Tax=Acaromyces ingoldii TaxID=215250 RepID=A0A316YPH9_9BASI|nr:Metallo-hydrolase/oxidoreductase [Acaromyces ingoldii]PWN90936.1 Metallo-hydrolase/oxidoreductase [Acaromyces ingoldii]